MNLKNKYIKYKYKYLQLKNQLAGSTPNNAAYESVDDVDDDDWETSCVIAEFEKKLEGLKTRIDDIKDDSKVDDDDVDWETYCNLPTFETNVEGLNPIIDNIEDELPYIISELKSTNILPINNLISNGINYYISSHGLINNDQKIQLNNNINIFTYQPLGCPLGIKEGHDIKHKIFNNTFNETDNYNIYKNQFPNCTLSPDDKYFKNNFSCGVYINNQKKIIDITSNIKLDNIINQICCYHIQNNSEEIINIHCGFCLVLEKGLTFDYREKDVNKISIKYDITDDITCSIIDNIKSKLEQILTLNYSQLPKHVVKFYRLCDKLDEYNESFLADDYRRAFSDKIKENELDI